MLVPYEIVHCNYTVPRVPGSGAFSPSTNGLASGNHLSEAALHGLCEVIERDAETLWTIGGEKTAEETRVDPASVNDPASSALLERFREAGIDVMIWDMTSDVGVACFGVLICDDQADADLYPYPAAHGSGCNPDRGIALCRALTEAAQSRLTAIAGSRDDLTIDHYQAFQSAERLQENRALARAPARRDFTATPDVVGESVDADLEHVLAALAGRGMTQAILVDLSEPDLELAFVRTIVPGLEMSMDSPSYLPRERALARFS